MAARKNGNGKKAAEVADRLIEKVPAAQRDEVSTKSGAGDYVILRAHGRSVGTVRAKQVKVVIPHDGSAASLAAIGKVLGSVVKQIGESKAAAPAKEEQSA